MQSSVQFVLITGLSGAGKTEAIRAFEDIGFFCIDNLPPMLISKVAELCQQTEGKVQRIAVVSDIRGGGFFDHLIEALEDLERVGFDYCIVFLEASKETLIRRFKETRRRHPLAPEGSIVDGIEAEITRLEEIRGKADLILDTTSMTPRMLREEIAARFLERQEERLQVSIISFGFKHGLPLDADLVFDVRFLPNPHYVPSLSSLTGNDAPVKEYVFRWPITQRFCEKLEDMIGFLLPLYSKEGKPQLIIGVGCTGGQHRSVAIANRLGDFVRAQGYRAIVRHRELGRIRASEGGSSV